MYFHTDAFQVEVDPLLSFPVNGTRFQIVCQVNGSDEQRMPNAQFVDANNKAYTNGSSLSIISHENKGMKASYNLRSTIFTNTILSHLMHYNAVLTCL